MAIVDRRRLFDGWLDQSGGVDAGRKSHLIDPDQAFDADNVVFRGGAPTNRPSIREVILTYENPGCTYHGNGDFSTDTGDTNQSITTFLIGLFQGACYFSPAHGDEYIMASINGRLFRIDPSPWQGASVREIILERRNRNDIQMAYMVAAGKYFVLQDGECDPVIFDGVFARRAGEDEIFTGKMMACGQGRIVMIGLAGQIYFGDLRGSHNGYDADADMLKFTETNFLAEGLPSGLESGMGLPTAVAFLPQQDSPTGTGDCIVFGETGAEGFTLSLPRDQWKISQFQRPVLRKIGCMGHRFIAEINNDIWFRSQDGWRSFRQARAEINKWAHIPLSTNVKQWVDAETRELLSYGSMISFDNRLIGTCTPYWNQAKPYHNGALAIDFDVISSFGQERKPAWDGHWTRFDRDPLVGMKVLQFVEGNFNGRHRAFAFVLNHSGHNQLIEVSRENIGDDTFEGTGYPVSSRLLMRSMNFQSEFNEEKLYGGDAWIDEVKEKTDFNFTFSPDQSPTRYPWHSFTVAPITGIHEGGAMVSREGFYPRQSLSKPPDIADLPANTRDSKRGYEFQVEMTWQGRATVRRFRAHTKELVEDSKAKVQPT